MSAEVVFGYPRDELLGQPVEMLVPERFRDGHPALRESYYADPSVRPMSSTFELIGRKKDGTDIPIDVSLGPIQRSDTQYVVSTIRDATERRRLESQLRQSQKMEAIGQLAGGVAHDFNNILTSILVSTELMRRSLEPELPADDPLLVDLEQIESSGQRAASLTR